MKSRGLIVLKRAVRDVEGIKRSFRIYRGNKIEVQCIQGGKKGRAGFLATDRELQTLRVDVIGQVKLSVSFTSSSVCVLTHVTSYLISCLLSVFYLFSY